MPSEDRDSATTPPFVGQGPDPVRAGRVPRRRLFPQLRSQPCTRQYIYDFDEAVASSSGGEEVVSKMTAKYPDLGNPYTLWLAAYTQSYGRGLKSALPQFPCVQPAGGTHSACLQWARIRCAHREHQDEKRQRHESKNSAPPKPSRVTASLEQSEGSATTEVVREESDLVWLEPEPRQWLHQLLFLVRKVG